MPRHVESLLEQASAKLAAEFVRQSSCVRDSLRKAHEQEHHETYDDDAQQVFDNPRAWVGFEPVHKPDQATQRAHADQKVQPRTEPVDAGRAGRAWSRAVHGIEWVVHLKHLRSKPLRSGSA